MRILSSCLGEDGTRKHYFPLKHWQLPTTLHCETAQKAPNTGMYLQINYVSGTETRVLDIVEN